MPATLRFLGATQTVTGSKYLLETSELRILVDCGMFQGYKKLRLRNWSPPPVDPSTIDMVVLTHAHIDHSGYLPVLVREGFRGPICCSEATRDLCQILLPDAGRIQEEDADRANRYGYTKHHPARPLFTEEEAYDALTQFKTLDFGTEHQLGDGLKLRLSRAGHILGSAFLSFQTPEVKLVFSGDLGRPNGDVMKEPAVIQEADYLVLESTYGNRLHPKIEPMEQLERVITKTVNQGGTVVIPAFAVGRTQLILYYLYRLREAGRLPDVPVYLDSPMAQDATDAFRRHPNEHRLSASLAHKVCSVARFVQTVEESKAIDHSPYPAIIISASGMAEGGRVLHHLKAFAPDHKSAILFTGFQAAGSRGDRILRGESEVKIHGAWIQVRAQVENIDSLSSHADYEETLKWLSHFRSPPIKVFLTHGEKEAAENLAQLIQERLGWNVEIPAYTDEVRL